MDEKADKSKKKVTFGKVKVRILDNHSEEDTDEISSREIAEEKQRLSSPIPQKKLKSILKPSLRTVSLDSGINFLKRTPKRFTWERSDRNYWTPSRKKSQKERESRNKFSIDTNTSVPERDISDNLNKNNMASAALEIEKTLTSSRTEKNNVKWEGRIAAVNPNAITSQKNDGIYSGVDWEQTRQLLSRIGVHVGEDNLQNPR